MPEMSNKKSQYQVVKYRFKVFDKGKGFIIEWRDKNAFRKYLYKWKLIQDDETLYEGPNYWVQLESLRGNAPATLIVIGRSGKKISTRLGDKPLSVRKTGWWKRGVDYSLSKIDERWVSRDDLDKEIDTEKTQINTSAEWINNLLKIGILAIGGIAIWKRLKK